MIVRLAGCLVSVLPEGTDLKNFFRGCYVRLGGKSSRILASRGNTVVHCGIFQIRIVEEWLRTTGPEGKLIAIEADPANCRILNDLVAMRECGCLTAAPKHRTPGTGAMSMLSGPRANSVRAMGLAPIQEETRLQAS